MSAIVLDIAVDQELVVRRGDDYDYICRVINVDESAYDFTNKIVILRVLSSINPDVELFSLCSDSASEIELSAGQMILHFTSTQLEQTEDTYFYDLKIVINSKTYTWLCGDFKIRTKIDNTAANDSLSLTIGNNTATITVNPYTTNLVPSIGIDLTGTKNGINKIFTIPETIIANTEAIYFYRQRLKRNTDYTISDSTITLEEAPQSGDQLTYDAWKVIE